MVFLSPRNLLLPRESGPFLPPTAILGGTPTPTLDVPISAFFLVLFVLGGATHFYTHEVNKKRQHKFHLSALMFDFCLVRTLTCIMRIVWAFRPTNNSVILTALIFENAGAVVLFAVNAIFTQRVVRATHPNFGWSPFMNNFFLLIVSSVPFIIIYNITFTVISFYTLNTVVLDVVRGFLLFGLCYTLILSLLPLLFVIPGLLIERTAPVEKFARGRFRSKVFILLASAILLVAGAVVRLTSYVKQDLATQPGIIDSKEVFYITGFAFELIVVVMYAVMRIDRRFWVPDGASGPGDYIRLQKDEEVWFQELDVKRNLSYRDGGFERRNWFGGGVSPLRPTREQVRRVIHNLGFPAEIVGMPMDCGGDEEILIYAFRVRKVANEQIPRRTFLRQSGRWSTEADYERQALR